ncbi:MAG: hypothetical protein Q8927_07100 [Bacteroidota bacterium]|nr:hypothetical protein [Bacteroidota bacterium]MDP4215952.1 hypothetical protein [Bacteroidota bacterium]MDP4248178.1 hypothetical protein [Bacteroidota bacterium]MDP4253801.1 hypothetical protein [Bacteroidota bacterium]MDP4259220.1 hypothetical protein [Bacteroidota bacterium]
MGTADDAILANKLGQLYQEIATTLEDYLHAHAGDMEKQDRDLLGERVSGLLDFSDKFFSLSDRIAFAGSDTAFNGVTAAAQSAKEAIRHIAAVNKVINITADVITLAASILTQNGAAVVEAVRSIIGDVKS